MTLIVMKPMKRGAPNWMPGKLPKINEEIMNCFYKEKPPNNIKLIGAPEIPEKEVQQDHTHFTSKAISFSRLTSSRKLAESFKKKTNSQSANEPRITRSSASKK